MKTRKVGVIGLGHVGAHVAYALAVQGIADELVLVDQNQQKLASEVQDLRDAAAYLPHRVTVRAGDFADLGECDVIVNSVGKIELLRGTHDRVTEMDFTIPAVRGYAEKVKASGFDGVLINITNPCDIVTRELALGLGLPKGRVFGTGTGLDTSRLLSALARQTGVDHKSITCYMLGEHGNLQFTQACIGKPSFPYGVFLVFCIFIQIFVEKENPRKHIFCDFFRTDFARRMYHADSFLLQKPERDPVTSNTENINQFQIWEIFQCLLCNLAVSADQYLSRALGFTRKIHMQKLFSHFFFNFLFSCLFENLKCRNHH